MKLLEKTIDWLIDVPHRISAYIEKITEFKITDAIKQMLKENKKRVKLCNKYKRVEPWMYVRKFLTYRVYDIEDTEYTLLKLGFIEFFFRGIYYVPDEIFLHKRRAYIAYDLKYKNNKLTVIFPIGQKVMFIVDSNCTLISKEAKKLTKCDAFYAHLWSASTNYDADTRKGNISLTYSYLDYKLHLIGFTCSLAKKDEKYKGLKLNHDKIPSNWSRCELDKFVDYLLGKYNYPSDQNLIALDYTQYRPINLY